MAAKEHKERKKVNKVYFSDVFTQMCSLISESYYSSSRLLRFLCSFAAIPFPKRYPILNHAHHITYRRLESNHAQSGGEYELYNAYCAYCASIVWL